MHGNYVDWGEIIVYVNGHPVHVIYNHKSAHIYVDGYSASNKDSEACGQELSADALNSNVRVLHQFSP